MKKIATIFERDWDGDRSRVLPVPTPGCEWVFAGEGVVTRKYDGTACLWREGQLWKRHEVRNGKIGPHDFLHEEDDLNTGKIVGWIPVGDGPEDKWHRDALARVIEELNCGTYELIGPKIQGNPEHAAQHELVPHARAPQYEVTRTYEGLKEALSRLDIEGFVFHHADGRMAKIKKRDFGLKREPADAG
jgi:hypothetical protein